MFFCFYNLDVCFHLRVIVAHNVCMRHTDVLLTAYENKLCSFNLWPLLEILITLGQVLFVIDVSIVFWNLSDGHLSKLSQTVRKLCSNSEIFYLYVSKSNPRLHLVSRYFTWLLDYKIASLQNSKTTPILTRLHTISLLRRNYMFILWVWIDLPNCLQLFLITLVLLLQHWLSLKILFCCIYLSNVF